LVALEREGFGSVLKRLLAIAQSPSGSPLDVARALDYILLARTSCERCCLRDLLPLAKRAFTSPQLLHEEKWRPLQQLASFGAVLATALRGSLGLEAAIAPLVSSVSDQVLASALTWPEWSLRVALLSGIMWNIDARTAYDKLMYLKPPGGVAELENHRNLQTHALHKAKEAGLDSPPAPRPAAVSLASEPTLAASAANTDARSESQPMSSSMRSASQGASNHTVAEARASPTASMELAAPKIRDADVLKANVVQGKLRAKVEHRTGGGFHLVVGDETGEIQIKFWQEAATSFKDDARLCVGAVMRFWGFTYKVLQGKDLYYAPAGRAHSLNFNRKAQVSLEVLEHGLPSGPLPVKHALSLEAGSRFDLRAWVTDVEDMEMITTRTGETTERRILSVSDTPDKTSRTMRWTLWGPAAISWGKQEVDRKRILGRGVRVTSFLSEKQLSGCASIEVI